MRHRTAREMNPARVAAASQSCSRADGLRTALVDHKSSTSSLDIVFSPTTDSDVVGWLSVSRHAGGGRSRKPGRAEGGGRVRGRGGGIEWRREKDTAQGTCRNRLNCALKPAEPFS